MRIRKFIFITVLTLVVAACGGAGTEETTTTDAPETTTSTVVVAPEAIQLSYALEAGQAFTYEVDMNQAIAMTIDGDPAALAEAEGEEVPEQMDITITGTTTFTHAVADGPEPGTYEVTITGDFSNLEFGGTVDGEPITANGEELPDMAEMDPVDVTIVVDEQGNIITDESAMGQDFLGSLGGLDMLSQLGSAGAGTDQFVGPPLTDEEVTVGDTWSETVEIPTLPDDDPITTTIESEVVAAEELDGTEVFVIETTTSTSAIEFDLAELLIGFMGAFVPDDATEEELAEMDSLVDELRFAFNVDPQVGQMTTWFDYGAGLTRQATFVNSTHMVMDINIPDEETNELVEMGLDMTIDQDVTYRLVDAGGA